MLFTNIQTTYDHSHYITRYQGVRVISVLLQLPTKYSVVNLKEEADLTCGKKVK
jgi:hypothetical protein